MRLTDHNSKVMRLLGTNSAGAELVIQVRHGDLR